MAKLALINKQHKREKLVAQYAKKRETIKAKMSVNATPEERIDAMKKLAKLPRNANPTRLRNRCTVSTTALSTVGFFYFTSLIYVRLAIYLRLPLYATADGTDRTSGKIHGNDR